MPITQETLRQSELLRRQLATLTDAQTLALTQAWVDAWDVLLPQFEAAFTELIAGAANNRLTRAAIARNVRLSAALQATREYLDILVPEAERGISRDIQQAVFDAVDGHEAIITTQLPPNVTAAQIGFLRVPDEALVAIVNRTTQQIHASSLPIPADIERIMKKALVRGIALGDNPKRTAAKLIKETEGRFNGGLTRALVISRTETLDAHRAATKASEAHNKQVLEEWVWSAKLDARTCPSCIAQHGSRHELTEDGPLDHHQGRCARVTVTKSWKDLGFNIKEPPSALPDAEAWFNNLTPSTQEEIMGATRLKMLQDGDITWADLSQRRETAGWRDSFHVTPIKDLQAKGGS